MQKGNLVVRIEVVHARSKSIPVSPVQRDVSMFPKVTHHGFHVVVDEHIYLGRIVGERLRNKLT